MIQTGDSVTAPNEPLTSANTVGMQRFGNSYQKSPNNCAVISENIWALAREGLAVAGIADDLEFGISTLTMS